MASFPSLAQSLPCMPPLTLAIYLDGPDKTHYSCHRQHHKHHSHSHRRQQQQQLVYVRRFSSGHILVAGEISDVFGQIAPKLRS